MINSPSRAHAVSALNRITPTDYYLAFAGLQSRTAMHEDLLIESDGEWWFNPLTLDKKLGLDGLTETQENIKLFLGVTHCAKCASDLTTGEYYDCDIDSVRIPRQFACKKCRHSWGPKASGQRDALVVAGTAMPRQSQSASAEPRPGTAGAAAFEVADRLYALPDRSTDWKTFRLAVIALGVDEGQNAGNVGTELPRWRRFRGVFP